MSKPYPPRVFHEYKKYRLVLHPEEDGATRMLNDEFDAQVAAYGGYPEVQASIVQEGIAILGTLAVVKAEAAAAALAPEPEITATDVIQEAKPTIYVEFRESLRDHYIRTHQLAMLAGLPPEVPQEVARPIISIPLPQEQVSLVLT